MPVTKKPAVPESERLQLARAMNNVVKHQEGLVKAMTEFKILETDHLEDLDRKIDVKRKELGDLDEEMEHKRVRGKIDCDNDIAKYRRDAALKMLEETKEVAIEAERLGKLEADLTDLRTNFEEKLAEIRRQERSRYEGQKTAAIRSNDLEHAADSATKSAQLEQKDAQIGVLQATISDLKAEVKSQRDLTERVSANFSRASTVPAYVQPPSSSAR